MAFDPKAFGRQLTPEQQRDFAALTRNTGGNFANLGGEAGLRKRYGMRQGPITPPGPPLMPPPGGRSGPRTPPGPPNLPRGPVSPPGMPPPFPPPPGPPIGPPPPQPPGGGNPGPVGPGLPRGPLAPGGGPGPAGPYLPGPPSMPGPKNYMEQLPFDRDSWMDAKKKNVSQAPIVGLQGLQY